MLCPATLPFINLHIHKAISMVCRKRKTGNLSREEKRFYFPQLQMWLNYLTTVNYTLLIGPVSTDAITNTAWLYSGEANA